MATTAVSALRIGILGWLNQDTLTLVSHPLSTHDEPDVTYHPGSATALTAIAAAELGAPVRFIGQIGSDPAGQAIRSRLDQAGVEQRVTTRGTTTTVVDLVEDSGQREQIAGTTAAHITPDELLDGDFTDLSVLHLTGYDLLDPAFTQTALSAVSRARAQGTPISFDATMLDRATRLGPTDLIVLAELNPTLVFTNEEDVAGLFPGAEVVPVANEASPGIYLANLSRQPGQPGQSPD